MLSMSIKATLFAIFATIVLLVGAQGWLATSNLGRLGDALTSTYSDLVPSVVAAKDMQSSWSAMQVAEAEHVMAKTPEARAHAVDHIKLAEGIWSKNSDFYKRLIDPVHVEEAERFVEIEKSYTAYKEQQTQILSLSDSGKIDEASRLFNEQVGGLFYKTYDLVNTLVDANASELKNALDEANNSYHVTFIQTIAMASATLLVCVLAMVFSQVGIGRPIKTMTEIVRRLAAGDLKSEIQYRGRRDEIGAIAEAVQIFKESAVEKERLAEVARQEADKQATRRGELEALIGGFEGKARNILDTFASAALDMRKTAESLSATTSEASDRGASVAAASHEASANVRSVAGAATQLGASVNEISRQVAQSSQVADQAKRAVQGVNSDVATLSDTAGAIGNVVRMISDIAGQTNLLALNATIEAARAGEAGKGFAVVAAEVKGLATQTAKATQEIATQISDVQSATANAVSSIGSIASTIEQMSEIAAAITDAMQQQLTATHEIDRNVHHAAVATQEVGTNIGRVAQAVSHTEQSASAVLDAAGNLQTQSLNLGREIEAFLAGVRAA